MPVRRHTETAFRQWISSSVRHPSSTLRKRSPLPRPLPVLGRGAFHANVAYFSTRQPYQEHRHDVDRENDGDPPRPQRKPSFTDSLYRRLREPRRSKGYNGNNFTPKDKKEPIAPESLAGSNDQAVKRKAPKRERNWGATETEELEEYLRRVAHRFPSVRKVHLLLLELIVRRSSKPTVAHYEAVILSNCDAQNGSSQAVKNVLQEMEREHIAIGSSIYEAVLKVLAIHPDYLLRSAVIESMAKQWVPLTSSMEHYMIVGYIREGQLERALQGIETMQQRKTPVSQWLHSLMLYSLCEVEDFDAVLSLLYTAEDDRLDIPTTTLNHILDRASECLHLDLTKRVWHDMVEPTYINPATGTCYNVLLTAARSGDTALAESVVKLLAHRQPKPSDLEYSLLEETYLKAGDEKEAKEIRLLRERRKCL